MKRNLLAAIIFLQVALNVPAAEPADPFAKWEAEIRAFEASDKTNPPPKDAILFVGSSSIRFWTNLAECFPDKKTIRRGFGGSKMPDALHFADRIILPYKPKQVVVYEGDNDLAAARKPEEIVAEFKTLVEKIHAELPATKVWFLSIKPSPSRWQYEAIARQINSEIATYARDTKNVGYIDVWDAMLGPDGKPRDELYIKDKLHMTPKGYEVWTAIISKKL